MSFTDCLSTAANRAFEMDTPQDLLPLTITHDACLLAGLESDHIGCATWD
jgi:hypothetical protein